MVDVVANHMGNTNMDFSQNVPFNQASHFHNWCDITDDCFKNKDMSCIQNCRLAKLADLNQDNSWVSSTLQSWIRDLVKNYTIDGLRIDTVPEVHPNFWYQFNSAAGVFQLGEVFDGDMGYVSSYIGPVTSVLNYPHFYMTRYALFKVFSPPLLQIYPRGGLTKIISPSQKGRAVYPWLQF